MQSDPLWPNVDLAQIVSKMFESIKFIPNTVTKIIPFEARFARPPNTELSNILTKPLQSNLTYKKLRKFASNKSKLKQAVFPRGIVWDQDKDSEPELDIQYRDEEAKTEHVTPYLTPYSNDSENAPLFSHTRVPGRFTPDTF